VTGGPSGPNGSGYSMYQFERGSDLIGRVTPGHPGWCGRW